MGGILTSKNNKSTTTTNLPSYVSNAFQQSVGQAGTAASQPFNYTGQIAAPTSDLQAQAYAGLPGAVNAAQPYIDQAAGLTAAGTTPLNVTPYTAANIQQYENPYTQDVVGATQQQFNLSNAQQQQALVGNAASNHALGGDRVAVAQAQLAGQQDTAQAATIAGLNQANYTQAQNEFNTQQQTGLAAQEAQNYTDLYGAGEYGNLGQEAQGSQLSGLGAELNAGTQQQATQQNSDTLNYQNYLTQLGYPLQQAQTLAGIAGTAAGATASKTTTTPGSSLLGSIAGLGETAAGLGLFAKGGTIPAFADGGDDDDSDGDDSDSDETEGEAALAGLAGVPQAPTETVTSQGSPQVPNGYPPELAQGNNLSPRNEGLLAAGLGTLAAQGRPLDMVGEGGLKGLSAYDSALNRQRQEQALQAQSNYRTSMSSAATTRAEALSQHYQNADNKPVVITSGKTIRLLHPSDSSIIDTGIPTAAGQNAESNTSRAKSAQEQADTARQRLQQLIKTGGAGSGGVFGFKLKAAKNAGMSDADALQFAGGHKEMSAADARKYAMQQATASANANKDSFDDVDAYNTYRNQAYQSNLGILMSGPETSDVPPLKPSDLAQGAPPVPTRLALPPGVPAGSLYSPSRKQYKDKAGHVYDATGKQLQ